MNHRAGQRHLQGATWSFARGTTQSIPPSGQRTIQSTSPPNAFVIAIVNLVDLNCDHEKRSIFKEAERLIPFILFKLPRKPRTKRTKKENEP